MINLKNYNNNDIFWRDFVNLQDNPYKLKTNLNGFKCLLIFPTKKDDISKNDYPLPLGHMASLLRMNNAKVDILLQNVEDYNINFGEYDLICFYPMIALFEKTLEFTKKLRLNNPLTKICFFNSDQHQHEMILCNPQAKEFAREIMEKVPAIDFILVGEAEISFIKLCEKIYNKESNISNIPSCLYKDSDQIKISEEPIKPVNFEFLPFPARDFLEKTISPEGINTHSPRIQSTRGCIAGCLYCVESWVNITNEGRKVPILYRDIIKTIDEIELLYKYYKVIFFNIIDSSFEDPGKKGIERMKLFFEEVLKRNIKASFKIHLRIETIAKLDETFFKLIKEAGVDILVIGIESGLEKELKSYKKIATVVENIENIKKLNDFDGIFFSVLGHMMFSPILTLEDLPKKMDFLKKINYAWDYLLLSHSIIIYRGTKYYEYIKKKGLVKNNNKFSPIIPYNFKDDRVNYVSDELNKIKRKCPEIMLLNNSLYDSLNIISRYSNKINQHLWKDKKTFIEFKEEIKKILLELESIYYGYFMDLVELAKAKWSDKKAEELFEKRIKETVPNILTRIQQLITNFFENYEKKGLSTRKLYLKTWKSIILTQINISGGKLNE